jgi:tetratricopeptide (TPR) repeat protein
MISRVSVLVLRLALAAACGVGVLAQQGADPDQLVKDAAALNTSGKQDEALALYRRALGIKPESFEAHLGMGSVLDLQGRYKDAREHLTRAIELAKDSAPQAQALNAMAVSYAFEGNAKDAAKYYQRLLDSQMTANDYAGAAATANALGRLFLETGDTTNALKWYQTGYETAKRLPDQADSQLTTWEMRWHHAQARIAARKGARAEADQHLAETKAVIEKMGPNSDQWPVYQYLAGYVKLYAGDYDSAIAELQKADQRDPFVLSLIAQSYEKKRDTAHAREYYEKVLASSGHSLQNAFARPAAKKRLGRR